MGEGIFLSFSQDAHTVVRTRYTLFNARDSMIVENHRAGTFESHETEERIRLHVTKGSKGHWHPSILHEACPWVPASD